MPVTFNETAHEPLTASIPADNESADAPLVAVAIPPQVLVRLLGVATTSPAGKLSVKATPVRATVGFAFARLNISEAVPLRAMLGTEND